MATDQRTGYGQTAAPDLNALSHSIGASFITGLVQKHQDEMQQKQQDFAAQQADTQRGFQVQQGNVAQARSLASQGYGAQIGPQTPAVAAQLNMPALNAQGADAASNRDFQRVRQAAPRVLGTPSDVSYAGAMSRLGDQQGPPDLTQQRIPGYLSDAQTAGQRDVAANALGVSLDDARALKAAPAARVGFAKDSPAAKIDPNSADVLDKKIAGNIAARRAGRAIPRPASGGAPRDRFPDIVKLTMQAKAQDAQQIRDIDKGVEAATRINLHGPSYLNPTPEQRKKAEADAKRSQLPRLAQMRNTDVAGLENATDDDVIKAYNDLKATPFDETAATEKIKGQFKSLEEATGAAPAPRDTSAGARPPRDEVEAEARAIAIEQGYTWDQLNNPEWLKNGDHQKIVQNITGEAQNRAAYRRKTGQPRPQAGP